ncbi:bifunctional hydroxymethylpyrimidine kinase/phosphomethylpyrimidine kinase [Cryptosporangium phraense]|uniref:Bifunctional hydroxymethylpyrimidine kinase/phosphomethylpyrimidine kinase n=1 Tax=Cryptosporangium phraense TaxID=2593070 RepID=A0A545AQW5_9ACTN|nr:bifunctional hydroxymethylpyrimidine kinase/phosphomethylpyrimidine kinase [Cryptosporangium phraense]TQS43631.1 bifunctional hydroxymethylpyrimidine kinase/phosphomethylpyrimidine kinase [Cryptosporangium phraense]
MSPVVALTVAGSDSGGGAGLQADLHTFAAFGVHGTTAVTAVTVQNTVAVSAVHEIPPHLVGEQIRVVMEDLRPGAVKTGMLASAPIIQAISDAFRRHGIGRGGTIPLVLDPVCASMHGNPLLRPDALAELKAMFALATVVTPNLDETQLLVGTRDQRAAARALLELGPQYALVKGGHDSGPRSRDLLTDGSTELWLDAARIDTGNTHGSGDTLGAAITARLAGGDTLAEAAAVAKRYVTTAVATSYSVGAGHGPVGHPPAAEPVVRVEVPS